MRNPAIYWKLCCAGAILLAVLTLTPLVIPAGVATPLLGGVPRTLWAGILIAIAFVVLTFIGSRVHPAMNTEEDA